MGVEDRLKKVQEFTGLPAEEFKVLENKGPVPMETLDHMIENVIGVMPFPFGIATNFIINGKEYLVPMVIEEASVVAAASNAARMARPHGGFKAIDTGSIMISQIQAVNVPNPFAAKMRILEHKDEILRIANEQDPILIKVGGGARDVRVRVIDADTGPMVITELIVDVRDVMGANAVNTMAEAVAPLIQDLSGGKVLLRILSNLADLRIVRAWATFDKDLLGGEEVVDGIIKAYDFAVHDIYRCATHNKGIMNGIDAVILATGNDFRGIEAGAHSYAARNGYTSLTTYEKSPEGHLIGTIEMPLAVGIIGGVTAVHPVAKLAVKILGVKTARELAHVIASVGLAQNLAALRALASEGIQKGHMALHARNIASMAGAKGDLIDKIAEQMVKEGKVRMDRAKELLEQYTK